MSVFAGLRVKTRCPQCRSGDFQVSETIEEIQVSTVRNGVFPDETDDHIAGGAIGVSCQCLRCSHTWRPRGARSVADIVDDD